MALGIVTLVISAQHQAQASARTDLATRFQLRATAAADFMRVYTKSMLDQERSLASKRLGAPVVTAGEFSAFRDDFGFGPGLLLDQEGRDLLIAPQDSTMVGTDLTVRYAHLQTAHGGVPAISNVVGSAATGTPIVAFAVPFDTPNGRRVVSGGFDLKSTPLGLYLDDILPPNLGASDLVDANGHLVVVRPDGPRTPDAALTKAMTKRPSGRFRSSVTGSSSYYATAPVDGTPWTLVLSSTTAALYLPANRATGAVPWLIVALIAASAVLAAVEFTRNQEARGVLEDVAARDALTGLPNRGESQLRLKQLMSNAQRYDEPLSLLMVDIDHFKAVNDTYGHPGGDIALRAVSDRISASIRDGDIAGRWGGEEFVIALPRTDAAAAAAIADRVRTATAALPVLSSPHGVFVTVSIGVATGIYEDCSVIVSMADAALYEAKHNGRDRVASANRVLSMPLG